MGTTIRRVVTGHNEQCKSCFIMDGEPPHVYQRSPGSSLVTELWDTSATPASNQGDADPTLRDFRLPPPKNGSVFRIITYPPDSVRLAALQAERFLVPPRWLTRRSEHQIEIVDQPVMA